MNPVRRLKMPRVPSFLLVILFACSVLSASPDDLSLPEQTFERLWKAFDSGYALFGVKNIDWKAIYRIYRPKVNAATSDDELFDLLSTMLAHLNDNHVHLTGKEGKRSFSAGYLHQLAQEYGAEEFEQLRHTNPVPDAYFTKALESRFDTIFQFGRLGDDIGYMHFNRFTNPEKSAEVVDEIVETFKDANAMIVDVRRNGGGDDNAGKAIADRFADAKRLYMITKVRNGAGYDDFDPPKLWYVEPTSPRQFTKSVILLIDRTSVSAAENFTLAMRVLPHVTVVGDTTSGCYADSKNVELPNGWTVRIPFNLFLDPNGFCWEGIGIPPDIRQINTKKDIREKKDRALELAIELIRTGKPNVHNGRKLYPIDN